MNTCTGCSESFMCTSDESCWCMDLPPILEVDQEATCLCESCLKEKVQKRIQELLERDDEKTIKLIMNLGIPKKLQEGIDYYINDDGLYVFTKWYHYRKGYCCGNECLHCPYEA